MIALTAFVFVCVGLFSGFILGHKVGQGKPTTVAVKPAPKLPFDTYRFAELLEDHAERLLLHARSHSDKGDGKALAGDIEDAWICMLKSKFVKEMAEDDFQKMLACSGVIMSPKEITEHKEASNG